MDRGAHQMSDWIECNLPWNPSVWTNEMCLFDEINKDLKEETDRIYKEIVGPWKKIRDDFFLPIQKERGDSWPNYDSPETDLDWQTHKANCKRVEEAIWSLDNLAPFQELDRRRDEFDLTLKQFSFCGRELNKPGTLVEVNGKTYLIGHMNPLNVDAGCCGGSCFEDADMVTRYKIIWSEA